AAQMLGMEGQGTAKVRVQVMGEDSRVLAGKLKPEGDGPKVAAAPRESVTAETLPPIGSREQAKPVLASARPVSASAARAASAADRVERELSSPEVETVPVKSTGIFVQAGSFARHDYALRLQARLSGVGQPQIHTASIKGQTVYRVRFGPLPTVEDADRLLDSVIAAGQPDAKVVVD
ncbi:MAG TPA: SPOR domain-containing protein, partial [Magnetospirillum sp.]|nr:SPOR domain-containing protein [Magnetospirillum sp.]